MPDPSQKDLLKKLAGKKLQLSTRCGTFQQATGQIKDVFDTFLLFNTVDERFKDQPPIRNWIWLDNIAVVTEDHMQATEEIAVTRFEF